MERLYLYDVAFRIYDVGAELHPLLRRHTYILSMQDTKGALWCFFNFHSSTFCARNFHPQLVQECWGRIRITTKWRWLPCADQFLFLFCFVNVVFIEGNLPCDRHVEILHLLPEPKEKQFSDLFLHHVPVWFLGICMRSCGCIGIRGISFFSFFDSLGLF